MNTARTAVMQRHALAERGNDLYETPACAVRALLCTMEVERMALNKAIWEPAAGRGAISRALIAAGFQVIAEDLVGYPGADDEIDIGIDFLMTARAPPGVGCIVTNPPYKLQDQFIRHGLELGLPVIVLLRLAALEGAKRSDLIDNHLRRVYVGIERLPFMHRDGWTGPKNGNSGAPFAWFVFKPGASLLPIELRRISWRA